MTQAHILILTDDKTATMFKPRTQAVCVAKYYFVFVFVKVSPLRASSPFCRLLASNSRRFVCLVAGSWELLEGFSYWYVIYFVLCIHYNYDFFVVMVISLVTVTMICVNIDIIIGNLTLVPVIVLVLLLSST